MIRYEGLGKRRDTAIVMKDGICKKALSKQKKLLSRECKRKVNREGQETKIITLETKYNKFTMYMLKHEKASSYQRVVI